MSGYLNRVQLIGNLGQDPEVRCHTGRQENRHPQHRDKRELERCAIRRAS